MSGVEVLCTLLLVLQEFIAIVLCMLSQPKASETLKCEV